MTQLPDETARRDDGRVVLTSRETVWKGFVHMQLLRFDQKMPDGRVVSITREVHDHGVAAAILLHDPVRDTVVLVRQFRPGVFINGDPAYMIEVPAGLTDGEDAAEAIRREAVEETGYAPKSVRHLFDIYASPGTLTEKVGLFVASVDLSDRSRKGGGLDAEGEDIEILHIPLEKAFAMIASGAITDAKTIILLQWAMMNRDSLT